MSAASKSGELAGIVYGPHVRVPLTEYVRRATLAGAVVRQCLLPCVSTAFVATTVPFIAVPQVRQYPDITHTLSDQFPLPRLHPAWSLTHGRQTCEPSPTRCGFDNLIIRHCLSLVFSLPSFTQTLPFDCALAAFLHISWHRLIKNAERLC